MTILFAENFVSCLDSSLEIDPAVFVKRYPGSRYDAPRPVTSAVGKGVLSFYTSSAAPALGSYQGPPILRTNIPKYTGDKVEIIMGILPHPASSQSTPSRVFTMKLFGLTLTKDVSTTGAAPIFVNGLDVGLNAYSLKFHAVLTRRSGSTWDMITVVTTNGAPVIRKNITTFELLGTYETTPQIPGATTYVSLPAGISSLAVVVDSPPGRMTNLTYTDSEAELVDAGLWTFSDTSISGDTYKVQPATAPYARSDEVDSPLVMKTSAPEYGKTLISGGTEDPSKALRVQSTEAGSAYLLRAGVTNIGSLAAPSLPVGDVTLTTVESSVIAQIEFDPSQEATPELVPDRVRSNTWAVTTDANGNNSATSRLPGGFLGRDYLNRTVGRVGFLRQLMPEGFCTRVGGVEALIVPPGPSTEVYPILGISSGTSSATPAFGIGITQVGGATQLHSITAAAYVKLGAVIPGTGWGLCQIRLEPISPTQCRANVYFNGVLAGGVNFVIPTTRPYLSLLGTSQLPPINTQSAQIGDVRVLDGELPALVGGIPTSAPFWPPI